MSGCARTNLTQEQIIRGQPFHINGIDALLKQAKEITKSLPPTDSCPRCFRPLTLEPTDFGWQAEQEFFYLPFLPAYTCDGCGETYLADPIHKLALQALEANIRDLELPVSVDSSQYRLRPAPKVEV